MLPGSSLVAVAIDTSAMWRIRGFDAPLLAHAPVEAFAQQIGMPAVPGVLLDAVDHQLAYHDLLPPNALAEVLERLKEQVGGLLLAMQHHKRLGDLGVIGSLDVEIRARRAVNPAFGLALADPVAPVPLHFAQMAQQPQQTERRGRDRSFRQLPRVQPLGI